MSLINFIFGPPKRCWTCGRRATYACWLNGREWFVCDEHKGDGPKP